MPGAHTALSAGAREFVPGGPGNRAPPPAPASGAGFADGRRFLSAGAKEFVPGGAGGAGGAGSTGRNGDANANASGMATQSGTALGSRAGATPLQRAALSSRAQVFVPRSTASGSAVPNGWGQMATGAAPSPGPAGVPQSGAPAMPGTAFYVYEPMQQAPHNVAMPSAPAPQLPAANTSRPSSFLNANAQEFTPGGVPGGAVQSSEDVRPLTQAAGAPVQDTMPAPSSRAPAMSSSKVSSVFNLSAYSDAESEDDFPTGASVNAGSSTTAGSARAAPERPQPQNRAAPRELWGSTAAAEARHASAASARGVGTSAKDRHGGNRPGEEEDTWNEAFQSPVHGRDEDPHEPREVCVPPSVVDCADEQLGHDVDVDYEAPRSKSQGEGGRSPGWARKQVQEQLEKRSDRQVDDADFPRLGSLPRKVAGRRPAAAPVQQASEADAKAVGPPLPFLRSLGSVESVAAKIAALAKSQEAEATVPTTPDREDDDEEWQTPADSEAEDVEADDDAKFEDDTDTVSGEVTWGKKDALEEEQGEGSTATTGAGLEETTEASREEALTGEEAEADAEGMSETPVDAEACDENDRKEHARLVQLKEQAERIRDQMNGLKVEDTQGCQDVEEQRKQPAWRHRESDRQRRVERSQDDDNQERRPRPWQNHVQHQASTEPEAEPAATRSSQAPSNADETSKGGRTPGRLTSGLGIGSLSLAPQSRLMPQGRLGTSPKNSGESFASKALLRWRHVALAEDLRDEAVRYSTIDGKADVRASTDRVVSGSKSTEGGSSSPAVAGNTPSWRDEAARAQKARDDRHGDRDRDRGGRRDGGDSVRKSERRRDREEKASKPLEISPSSWVAQQQQFREATKGKNGEMKSDSEVVREMKLILNKLTIEKFDTLYLQLTNCGICKEEHVEILMCEVFEKATTQHHFIGMYAELCAQLHKWFVENQVGSGNDGKVFKRILLNQCQLSFEQNLRPVDLQMLDPEKREEAEHRHKTRMLGNLRFVGALLEKGMLASKILLAVVEKLLEGWTPVTLECLSVFLVAVGPAFDRPDWMYHAQLKEVFNQVRLVGLAKEVPSRVRYLLQDVLDLRKSGWKNQKKAVRMDNGPMTLEEVQKQAEEEHGEKITLVRPTGGSSAGPVRSAINGGKSPSEASERSADRRNYREGGSSATAPGRSATAFNIDRFHAELPKVLKELRQSLDIDEAFERITAHGLPSEHQAAEFADLLAAICEMGQANARVAAFKLAVRLFLKGSWQKRAVTDGLERFFGEMYSELKIDLPNLPCIVREELAPALGGLVDAGLLSTRFREELLNIV